MSAYVRWIEDFPMTFTATSGAMTFTATSGAGSSVTLPDRLMLNVSPYSWAQFVVEALSFTDESADPELTIEFETTIDGAFYERSSVITVKPSTPVQHKWLIDNDSSSTERLGRLVRVRFSYIDAGAVTPNTVHVSIRALLKNA